jgi:hypothetical protein
VSAIGCADQRGGGARPVPVALERASGGGSSRQVSDGGIAVKNKLLIVFAVTVGLLLVSGSTYAHHGVAIFDMARITTVQGVVTSFEWTNPHAYIYLDIRDDKGNVEKWSAELGSLGMLGRVGWRKDIVKPGDQIAAVGNRAKDGRNFMHLDKIVFADGQELSANVL